MIKKTIALSLLATTCMSFILYTGCVVRKHKAKKKEIVEHLFEEKSKRSLFQFDSTRLKDSTAQSYLEFLSQYTTHYQTNKQITNTLETEKTTQSVEIKGELFKTSIKANWILDTNAIEKKELVYFDMDNPSLKAKIYADIAGNMQIEIQTKDKVVNIPIDKLKFQSSSIIQNDSTQKHEIQLSTRSHTSVKDSGVHSLWQENMQLDIQKKFKKSSSSVEKIQHTFPWYWMLIGVFALLLIYLGWRFKWISNIILIFKKLKSYVRF